MNSFFGVIQNNKVAILNEDESLHCVKVLRHKVGDIIEVINGEGIRAIGKIEAAHAKQCAVSLSQIETIPKSRNYYLHIAIAPTKNIDRIEWFVEKAVEIGIDEITFLHCKNSERSVVKDDRMRKVAESAVKQSKQAYIPKLNSIIDFKPFVKNSQADIKLIAHCDLDKKESINQFDTKNKSCVVLIGPEGDFNKNEIALAIELNYKPITLGQSRLRTETAGLFVCNAMVLLNS